MTADEAHRGLPSNGENFAICLDGVGGTIEFGVDSHHYARDFRDCLRTNIRRRVASADKRRYDAEVRSLLYPGVSAKQIGGGSWLRDLPASQTKTRRVASLCSRHIVQKLVE